MHLGAPERLVGVDVPDARERALVEKHRFHGSAPAGEAFTQVPGTEVRPERLRPDPFVDVRIDLARLEEQPGAEAPDIRVDEIRSVV